MAFLSHLERIALSVFVSAALAPVALYGQEHAILTTGLLSASGELPVAPVASPAFVFAAGDATFKQRLYRPFRAFAVSLRVGSGGLGGEIATPLLPHTDLRAGAQLLGYTATFTTNGIPANATLSLENLFVAVDYFPVHHGFLKSFRIAPGLTLHNDNHVAATLMVPGGQSFTLNSVDYTSEASDPIVGNAHLFFGKLVAPRLTFGTGNMFPPNGGHWSFPAEIGFEYASSPSLQLNLGGSACSTNGCGSIDTPDNLANIDAEVQKIDNELAPLRFFPIVSAGVAYRFGH